MKKIIVGLNIGHDGGAAIIQNGKIARAISEERLNRKKYSPGYLNSLFYCLNDLKIKVEEISHVVISGYGRQLNKNSSKTLKALNIPQSKFIICDHHLSHAYGAFFLSGFDKALVLIIDGEGNNNETESYFIGEGQHIEKIGGNSIKRNPAKGIGRTYEAFTNFLGWVDQEAGKTMGLAAFGDSSSISTTLFNLNGLQIEGALDKKYENGVFDFCNRNHINFGKAFCKGETHEGMMAASYVQRETERIIIELVKKLVQKTGVKKLCLSGGVALNCNVNNKILESGIVDELFILPASSDKGQAIGNALYGFWKSGGEIKKEEMKNDFFGKTYAKKEILLALQRSRDAHISKQIPYVEFEYEKLTNKTTTAAQLISQGKILGWFQGGSELGPRALGHRSILCDPRNMEVKKRLNNKIKKREKFRPFAPSCLLNKVNEFFNINRPSPFMLLTPKTKNKNLIPAVIHIDGTSRVQTVTEEANGSYFKLIKEFYKITGVPMVLNTSFNCQEPIVETPGNAISTFLKTEIDYLILEDYLIWKKKKNL